LISVLKQHVMGELIIDAAFYQAIYAHTVSRSWTCSYASCPSPRFSRCGKCSA
jgi:hypothetical protein